MYKNATKHKHSRHNDYDLYSDLLKIRDAFTDTAKDVRGKTGKMISDSFDNMKERSANLQNNVLGYAQEKPYKTMGIILLTGLVVGYFLHRK